MESLPKRANKHDADIEDAEIVSEKKAPIDSDESPVNESGNETIPKDRKTSEASESNSETPENSERESESESNLDFGAEQVDDPEQAFADAKNTFEEIKDTAEKLKSLVPEINSYINGAKSAISAFDNIREEDDNTRKELHTSYLGVLNRNLNSINELIEENKDKLETQDDQDQKEEEKLDLGNPEESEAFEEKKSEIILGFSSVESKFEKIVNKAKSTVPNEYFHKLKPDVRRIIEMGTNAIKEFNELAKIEPTEENLNQLEEKKKELESVIASLAKKVNETEGVENNPNKETEQASETGDKKGDDEKENQKSKKDQTVGSESKEDGKKETVEVEDVSDPDKVELDNISLGKESDPKTVNVDEKDLEAFGLDKDKDNLAFSTKNAGGVEDIDTVNSDLEFSTTEENRVENLTDPNKIEDKKELTEYQKVKQALFANEEGTDKTAKEIYRDNKKEYDDAVKDYYDKYKENRSRFGKVKDWGRKFLGLKPELPDDIKALEDKYKLSRKNYTDKLRLAMKERGKLSVNKEFHKDRLKNEMSSYLDSNNNNVPKPKNYEQKVDSAFLKKFVLRPGKEILDLQKTEILTEEQSKSVERVMMKLKKNKWYVRGVIVTGATVLGTVTGGALVAGLTAGAITGSRMAIGAGAGMAGGFLADTVMSFKVNKAEARAEELMEGDNFSVADIDKYEEEVMTALRKAKAAQSQRVAAVATAGMAGGFAGAYYAPDSLTGVADVAEKVSDSSSDMPSADTTEVPEKTEDHIASVIEEAMKNNPGFEEVVSGDTTDTETNMNVTEDAENIREANTTETSVSEPKVVIEKLNVPIYSTDNSWNQMHNYIEDISVNGADGLEAEQMSQVRQFIQLKANDILAGEPHMSAEKLGTELQSLLEKRFGGESWWEESPISKVDIGNITKVGYDSYVDVDSLNKPSEENSSYDWTKDNKVVEAWREQAGDGAEMMQEVEMPDNIYEVQPGDKLWTIMKDQYADILDKVPESEHNQILAQLFNNVNTNPELLESLNLKSGDNIHLIYPDEKINIGPLGEELKRIVELGNVDDLPTKGATGPLGVETTDGPVKNIPINFAEQGRVDSGFDLPSEKAPVNFARDGVDNPFDTGVTEDTTPTSVAEKNTNGAESVESGEEIIQFATKAGTPTELTLRMNEFVQQTASEMLAKNPSIGTDPTAFRNAVWQAFAEEFKTELNGSNQMVLKFEPSLPNSAVANTINDILPPPQGTPPGVPPDLAGQVPSAQEIPPGYVEMTQEVANGSNLEPINMATSMDDPALNQMRAEVFQNSDKFEKAVEAFAKTQEDRSIFDFNDSVFETVGNTMTISDLDKIVQMGKVDALSYLEQNNIDVSYEDLKGWTDYVDAIAYDPANNPNGLLVTENTTLRNLVERDVVISSWMEKQNGTLRNVA